MKLKDFCRFCLIKCTQTSDEIFFPIDENVEKKYSEITTNKLARPGNAEELDKFPLSACITCVSELEKHYDYRNSLVEKQNRLNRMLGYKEPIQEPETAPSRKSDKKAELEEIQSSKIKEEGDGTFEVTEVSHEDEDDDFEEEHEGDETLEEDEAMNAIKVPPEDEDEYFESPKEDEQFAEDEMITSETDEVEESAENLNEIVNTFDQLEEDYEATADYQVCFVSNDGGEEYVDYDAGILLEETSIPKRKYTKRAKDAPRPYKCWIKNCTASFAFRGPMKKHANSVHSIDVDRSTCLICGSRFEQYADFLAHVKNHTRKSQCSICKMTFVSDETLSHHQKKFHPENKDECRVFGCLICEARFKRREHLNSHMVYKHSNPDDRTFKCDKCPSTFLTRQDLRNHDKSHLQVMISCLYCSYNCRDLKSIRRHCLKLHETTKIYKCSCEEKFELHKELLVHRKTCGVIIDTSEY